MLLGNGGDVASSPVILWSVCARQTGWFRSNSLPSSSSSLFPVRLVSFFLTRGSLFSRSVPHYRVCLASLSHYSQSIKAVYPIIISPLIPLFTVFPAVNTLFSLCAPIWNTWIRLSVPAYYFHLTTMWQSFSLQYSLCQKPAGYVEASDESLFCTCHHGPVKQLEVHLSIIKYLWA